MRNPNRIEPFLRSVDLEYLFHTRWKINQEEYPDILEYTIRHFDEIEIHWKKYPDLRFGQMLISLGFVPDSLLIWNDEENWIKTFKNEMES